MPELKEWSEQFKIHILECDLRWGVPKNTDTEETISICLDEITQCISETNGEPFLVSLLSERCDYRLILTFIVFYLKPLVSTLGTVKKGTI